MIYLGDNFDVKPLFPLEIQAKLYVEKLFSCAFYEHKRFPKPKKNTLSIHNKNHFT